MTKDKPSTPKAAPATRRRSSSSAATREALIDAAIATLRDNGFGGATARAIAKRAGCNQALVFYHFGSVIDLLLAALDAVSAQRLERYTQAIADAHSPTELVSVAAQVFREDLANGHVTVLAAMLSGASSTPGLGEQVAARLHPWTAFAQDAVGHAINGSPFASLLPTDDIAYAVVALYLGIEMLSHLDGDTSHAESLFEGARTLAALFESVTNPGQHDPTNEEQQ